MRSKVLISTVAFITAFAFSAAFAGLFINENTNQKKSSCFHYKSRTDAAITVFVSEDVQNGERRDNKLYQLLSFENYDPFSKRTIADYAEVVEKYADESGAMSDSHLPPDFQRKWREHMRAWRDYSNFLNRVKKYPHKLEREKTHQLRAEFSNEINTTWYDLLHIGRSYGAEVDY